MKCLSIIFSLICGFALTTHAQIPNQEFEQWWTVGNCQVPTDYFTYNLISSGSFYPVSRDTSHYPSTIGSSSIRLENKISLLPANESKGIIVSSLQITSMPSYQTPSFKINGHPNFLTGYYKYAPQNGDTMWIAIKLFLNGSIVSQGSFYSKNATSIWNSFIIPLSSYSSADSAEIIIAAYNADQPNKLPLGNSVLNVDNLNFDNLISSLDDAEAQNDFCIFPNPTNGTFNLLLPSEKANINIFNMFGQMIYSTQTNQKFTTLNIDNVGVYMIEISTQKGKSTQKLIINR